MRALAALTLFVSLTTAGLGQEASGQPSASDWKAINHAGLQASREHRHEEALTLFRQAETLAEDDIEQALSVTDIGLALHNMGRDAEALQPLERSRILLKNSGADQSNLVKTDGVLAGILRDKGDYGRAETCLKEALASLDGQMPDTAYLQTELADLLREQGRHSESMKLFQATLTLPGVTPHQRLQALLGVADVDCSLGELDASIRMWNEGMDLARQEHDAKSEGIALRGLAQTWMTAGSATRAEPLLRKSLSVLKATPEQSALGVAGTYIALGELYSMQGKFTLAEDSYEKALELSRSVIGENHPQIAHLMERLAGIYAREGQIDMARDLSQRAFGMMQSIFGKDTLPVAGALASRGYVEVLARDLKSAAANYQQAAQISKLYPEDPKLQLFFLEHYRDVLKAMHRDREATELTSEVRNLSNSLKAFPLR